MTIHKLRLEDCLLYQDNHLLVVNKPTGIATMGAETSAGGEPETLHSLAADYLRRAYNKPHGVYVGIVSRLDMMTSGVIVMARTSKAAGRLSAQFAAKSGSSSPQKKKAGKHAFEGLSKTYLAIVDGTLESERVDWIDHVLKDDSAHRMRMVSADREGAKRAHLNACVLQAHGDDASVVAVRLLTGRKHQIRVQFSGRGHAILGDRKYASERTWPSGIALHSHSLTLLHPTRREPMTFTAKPPACWNTWFGAHAKRKLADWQ